MLNRLRLALSIAMVAAMSATGVAAPMEEESQASARLLLQQRVAAVIGNELRLNRGSKISARDLQVLTPDLQIPQQAELRVVSSRPAYGLQDWLVSIDCANRRDCLPFDVILHSPAADLRKANTAGSPVPVHKPQPQPRPSQLLARSGDRVLLVQELPGIRLQVQAVCLQSGALGQTILVRNVASHRVLLATIAGKTLVRVE